jgi:hypothetical protein
MTRTEVFAAISAERESQDEKWRDGRPVENQYVFSAPHILLLEEQVAKLRANWYGVKDESSLRERLIKVATIAVRALEEITVTR